MATDTTATKSEKSKQTAKGKKRIRRSVSSAIAHIQSSFNNTIVTITDLDGMTLTWSSSGSSGFKGTRKSTPYAAQVAAQNAAEKSKAYGVEKVDVIILGVGPGREQAIRGLQQGGLEVESIKDVTPIPHNGCRKRRPRRV